MKFLHTADWHLGRSLYGRKRYEEFAAFLEWLGGVIEAEGVDALLVAGDVFDTCAPSNRAQELYYRFLCRVALSRCRCVVVIGGNHDSPSFLNAPKEILGALSVRVVGAITGRVEDEVVVVGDGDYAREGANDAREGAGDGNTRGDAGGGGAGAGDVAIVCAVPYMRDKDIRTVEPGESADQKNRKLIAGIRRHYEAVVAVAERKRAELLREGGLTDGAPRADGASLDDRAQFADRARLDDPPLIPIVAMGHLFAAGGKTVEGDGVRELYVGSLAHVSEDIFPASIDYLALGHLHVAQRVGGADHIRYCGSPIPMGYGEAGQRKGVIIVEFRHRQPPTIRTLPVPCFQPLERIVGSLEDIRANIERLKREGSRAWLEIEYTGRDGDVTAALREMLDDALADSAMEVRRVRNKAVIERVIGAMRRQETLDDLGSDDIFARCMDAFDVPAEERAGLIAAHDEIVAALHEEDANEL